MVAVEHSVDLTDSVDEALGKNAEALRILNNQRATVKGQLSGSDYEAFSAALKEAVETHNQACRKDTVNLEEKDILEIQQATRRAVALRLPTQMPSVASSQVVEQPTAYAPALDQALRENAAEGRYEKRPDQKTDFLSWVLALVLGVIGFAVGVILCILTSGLLWSWLALAWIPFTAGAGISLGVLIGMRYHSRKPNSP